MGHLNCKCGASIKLKTSVEEHEKVLLDKSFLAEQLPDLIEQLPNIEASLFVSQNDAKLDFLLQKIDNASVSVVFCNNCNRLWLHQKTTNKYISYEKDSDD